MVRTAEEIRALAERLTTALQDGDLLLSDRYKVEPLDRFVAIPETVEFSHLWIIGDLHGDLLAMKTALHYATDKAGHKENTFAFLGDLFDRGKFQKEVLYETFALILEERGRCLFVVGNHDEGLRVDEEGAFSSSVHPCEFASWLNQEPSDSPWRDLARVAIAFFAYAPRAVLLPDGILLAHGGVPHVDRLSDIQSIADLSSTGALEDFVWTRLHESAKKKIPNRSTRGCSLGINDFNAFCEHLFGLLRRPVRGMVRGHDHLEARFAFFEKYRERPVLTINTICYRQEGEMFGEFHRPVIVAEWQYGAMPVVHAIELPPTLIDSAYGHPLPLS